MKTSLAIAASMLALTACQPAAAPEPETPTPIQQGATPETPLPTQVATGCAAHAETNWTAGDTSFLVTARTEGPDCAKSTVLLTIRTTDGTPFYTWSGLSTFLFGLMEARSTAEMTAALSEWITPSGPETTASLPPWEETEAQPKRAEFPFMPTEWMDKQAYDGLKTDNVPVYCFPQGMESLQCIAARDGQLEEIGLQLFPG